MWPPKGKSVSGSWLNFQPIRVLYDVDGPRIFVCSDSHQQNFLAYQCGESDCALRFLVVPIAKQTETKLTLGDTDLRDVLLADRTWLFDVDFSWAVVQAWEVNARELPENCIPRPGIMLWAHLTPRRTESANGHVQVPAVETVIENR